MRRSLNFKLLGLVVGGLLVTSVSVHFLHGYQLQRNAFRLRERAEFAAEEKNDARALAYYRQYLSFVPNDADATQKYAEVLDRNAFSDAERLRLILLMEQVLRAKPNESALRLRLVHHLIAFDRFVEAIANLKKLEGTAQDNAEILHMIGWCQDAVKDYARAAQSFEAAVRANAKQIKSYALLAEVLGERLHQPDEAQKVLDDLVRENSESYQVYLLRARFQRRRGDDKSAESDLQKAYALGKDQPHVILEVADAARGRGDWTEAVKVLQDGMKRFPNQVDFLKALSTMKTISGQRDEAIQHLKDGLKHAPNSAELSVLLIELLIDQRQYTDARAKIAELGKTDVNPAFPNYLKARLAMVDQQWHEAIKLLEQARIDLGPGSDWNSRVHVLLGMSQRALGDHDRELKAYREAVRAEPSWVAANIGLGTALLSNGRIEEACQTLEPLRKSKDLPAGYWTLLSRARLQRQERLRADERSWEAVEEALTRADRDAPKSVELAVIRAQMLASRADFAAARDVLTKARSEHPADVTLTCALAELAVRQGRFDEADSILAQADDHLEIRLAQFRLWGGHPTPANRAKLARQGDISAKADTPEQRARLQRELADTWHRMGDSTRAESIWRDLAKAWPRDLRSRSALLELAIQRNQAADARNLIAELRVIEGEDGSQWRYGEAALLVQEARGDRAKLAEARARLQMLDKLHKGWPRVAVLAGVISELEGKPRDAIADYTRALEQGETQPRVLASLLGLLLQRREYSKAETELARYEQRLPLTPELARLGAEVALGMRDRQYARLAARRAELAVTPQPRDYRDALWLARIYRAAEDNTKAESLLSAALEQAGHTPETWIAWMEYLHATDQRERGVKDLERMKRDLPASRQALTLARCYEALHLPAEAAAAYAMALQSAPSDFIVIAHAAEFERRADRADQAVKLYERLLDPALDAPAEYRDPARRRLAILMADRNPTAALALVDGAAMADQRIRWFIQSLTPSTRKEALARFEESLAQNPATADERVLLARMLEAADKMSQARTVLSDLVGEHPSTPYYLVRYARILFQLQEVEEARRVLVRLEALEPNSQRMKALGAP